MLDLSAFPITQRGPAKHPDRLQLYSLPTPNGVMRADYFTEAVNG
jgi:GST-like protein